VQVLETLGVAVAQPLCVPHDVTANAASHAAAVRAAGARLVVFPELSLTGYELDALAISVDDDRLSPLVQACAETDALALVGAPLAGDGGRACIAMLIADGGGIRVAYRKIWLGAEEAQRFVPGDEPAVLEVDGWRLGLAICRDTGIARHVAETAALGIDAFVAGTVMAPQERAIQDDRARRIAAEHDIWVAVASFAGATGGGYNETLGCSGIWGPGGELVTQLGPQTGAVARAALTAVHPHADA